MAPTMTHLAMHVKDLSACIDFYERYCAMYIAHDRDPDGHRVVWPVGPEYSNTLISREFVQVERSPPRGVADQPARCARAARQTWPEAIMQHHSGVPKDTSLYRVPPAALSAAGGCCAAPLAV